MPRIKPLLTCTFRSHAVQWIGLLAVLCLPLAVTLPDYGLTYDEPIYMESARHVETWLSLGLGEMLDRDIIERYWGTDPGRNVHPSGLKWLYVAARKVIVWEKDPYQQCRILNVLIFSISALLFVKWWGEGSLWRAIAFVLLLLTIPRFFAHLHFAATDIPMTSFFLLFLVCLHTTLFGRAYLLAGLLLGLVVSMKITALLLVLALFPAYVFCYRQAWKKVLRRLALISLVGLLVFYVINPDWWFSPFSRGREFLILSLTRASWSPISVYFGGHIYPYRGPFYYPFVIFLITTPLLHLVLLLWGLGRQAFQKAIQLKRVLLLVCLASPFLILALPLSPTNDGARYLLPAFPFATAFMTLGLEGLWRFVRSKSGSSFTRTVLRLLVPAACLALLAVDLHNPARVPPYELSYYNALVGGLSGAHKRGYETTYWWEILNHQVLASVNDICRGAPVYFPAPPTDLLLRHLKRHQAMAFIPTRDYKQGDFMLILGRPHVRFWEVKALPLYRKLGKIPVPAWQIALDGVPLIRVYEIRDPPL